MNKWLLNLFLIGFLGLGAALYAAEAEVKRSADLPVHHNNMFAARPSTVDKWFTVIKDKPLEDNGFHLASLPKEIEAMIGENLVGQYRWFINPKIVKTDWLQAGSGIGGTAFSLDSDKEDLFIKANLNAGQNHDQLQDVIYRYSRGNAWSRGYQKPTAALVDTLRDGVSSWGAVEQEGWLRFEDNASGKVIRLLDCNTLLSRQVYIMRNRFSPQKKYAYVVCKDKFRPRNHTLLIFDAKTHKLIKTFENVDPTVAFTSDERFMAYGVQGRGASLNVLLYDIKRSLEFAAEKNKESEVWCTHAGVVSALAFSPDNNCLAVGFQNGTLALVDTQSRRQVRQFKYQECIAGVMFSPSNNHVVVVAATPSGKREISIIAASDCTSWQEMLALLALQNAQTADERRSLLTTATFASLSPMQQDKVRKIIDSNDARLLVPELGAIDSAAMVNDYLPVMPAPVVPVPMVAPAPGFIGPLPAPVPVTPLATPVTRALHWAQRNSAGFKLLGALAGAGLAFKKPYLVLNTVLILGEGYLVASLFTGPVFPELPLPARVMTVVGSAALLHYTGTSLSAVAGLALLNT